MSFFALPDNETLSLWILNYGNFTLFTLLALGIVALPVPEETLLVVVGYLISEGKLPLVGTALSALLGSIMGITVSYLIGKYIGHFLLKRRWINPLHVQKAESWFERYGKWFLVIGYFIPGIRHVTGFSSGMATLPYTHFAPFAYCGALIWVTTFLTIGYFFGNECLDFCKSWLP